MSNISVQLRRGTDTEHSSFTGAEGEVTVDTTNDTLRVHDGSTAGGVRLAKLSEAGGSGTVTSVDSGTGLTGGPITTSGTLSLAPIANLRALGNVSGGSAAPVAIDIKDEDTMTSDSATALATQQSIKAYVDSQLISKYSTGWVNTDGTTTVANSATLSFTHNLGTTDLIITCYVADDASGTNSFAVSLTDISTNSQAVQVKDITTTAFTVQLGSQGTVTTNSSGVANATSLASKYIKIVAIA
jgi:hypothetical protein